ncbi:unnamed protein product [Adineta steineri]|uniref:Uncharacterized protein n=2 Tax=Adineta steineri TaxID=433720 RepID=A0A819T629_9BILA|nr:unnamed protein product [Adineta steineri]
MDLVFQKTIKTLRGTSTTIVCQLSNDNNNCSSYYLLHPYLVLLPDVETTFLPVRIQNCIYSSKTKTNMNQSTNIEVCGNYYDNICEPIFTFEIIVIQQIQGVQSGRCNQDLIESIEPFNELATYYAQMAIKDLDLNQQHHPLLNACRSLASTLHLEQLVTWHSTHLRLIQLIERFPRLKPFLIALNKYGLHLKDILSEEKNGLDIFVEDDEIGETFRQIKTLIRATKIQQVFYSICQYLQLQYERQTKDDNSFENYRLRIFRLTDSHCSDVLPILDLFLNLSQQTGLLIDLYYADSDPIQLANAQQTFNTHLTNQTKDLYDNTICFGISVLLTTYKQVSIIFAWQLDQVLLNENNDDLAFKQNEELISGTLSLILQTIQKSSPYFYPFVHVLTDHAQFNNDSNLNIIPSPFIGLARSLITEYERHRLQLIDPQTSLNNNNQSIFIHTCIEYMINSRYSTDTCEVVLRLNDTNQNQVQHLTWHYEMLQNNDEQKKSKYEQIYIIPKRDADQKSFCICVSQSRFLFELTWIEENREKELLPSDMVD